MLARGTPWSILLLPVVVLVLLVAWHRYGLHLAWLVVLVPLLALSLLAIFFFRDPDRVTADGLVAPAHGSVLDVVREDGHTRVSTFMSPLDVHVVRAPLGGEVVSMERSGSTYHPAYRSEAGHNVQLEMRFEGGDVPFTLVLISGWVARRIVPYVSVGDQVTRGGRVGLIRFGSRVDVIVPEGAFDIDVGEGDRVTGGSSSLGVRAA